MLLIYNLLLIVIPLICLPCLMVLLIYLALGPKYRGRLLGRLGVGLADRVAALPPLGRRIWIHALSVGEVSSARSLVHGLRRKYPDAVVVFSASTRSGGEYALSTLSDDVDLFLPFPLDFYWTVEKFIGTVEPTLFVLVETDLWPNFLGSVRRHKIPSILVNGRVSEESFNNYLKLQFLFSPMFNTFDHLALQTTEEKKKMAKLGVQAEKIHILGNLKYESLVQKATAETVFADPMTEFLQQKKVIVAGSTHSGEEILLLKAFTSLKERFPDLYLVIAPRNVDRGGELVEIAKNSLFSAVRRSLAPAPGGDILILDTLGELAGFYGLCDIAFVGGSLVEQRGHNPLEPAAQGKPVLFGPHMEDFQEIAADLVSCGGAVCVENVESLTECAALWLADHRLAEGAGRKGLELVEAMSGVTARHLELVERLLTVEENA